MLTGVQQSFTIHRDGLMVAGVVSTGDSLGSTLQWSCAGYHMILSVGRGVVTGRVVIKISQILLQLCNVLKARRLHYFMIMTATQTMTTGVDS